MKRLLSHLFIALILVGCGKFIDANSPRLAIDDDLIHIDSLMQHDPDSALQALLSWYSGYEVRGSSPDYNVNYHRLLLSEVLYKTGNPQYYRDSLQAAMRYFDSIFLIYPQNDEIAMLTARSHYMNGVSYYENDSVVEACHEYLNALEIMEEHFEEKDFIAYKAKFMGLLYTRLGELLLDHGVKKASIEMNQNAVKHFEKVDGFCLANPIRSLALSFEFDNQIDSAVFYYRQAIVLAKKYNKRSVLGKCLSEMAPIYYDMGNKDSAFITARTALSLQTSEDSRLTQCYILGSMFAKECIYDSAIYYLEQGINRDSYATKAVAAELLMQCHLALGDTVQMQYYKNIYGEKLDEYRYKMTNANELAKIYESHKHNKLQKEYLKNIRRRSMPLIIVSIFIISIIIGVLILIRKHIISLKKKSQYNIDETNKALAEMKRKIEANPFVTEPICKYILDVVNENNFKAKVDFRIYKEFALNKNQIMLLRDSVDRHYNHFSQTLCKTYPDLTIDDIDYCCFYLLGLKKADISALIQRAYPTVYQRSHKLKRIFNTTESLQSFIAAMAYQSCQNT